MADGESGLQRTTSFLRALLLYFRLGLGLVFFVPVDATLLASQTGLPTHDWIVDAAIWLAVLVAACVGLWMGVPRARHAAFEERFGPGEPREPTDARELLVGEVGLIMGLFLSLLSRTEGKPAVGREWQLGFLAAGLAAAAYGAYVLFRYARPKPD